jgi:hypothetical protein
MAGGVAQARSGVSDRRAWLRARSPAIMRSHRREPSARLGLVDDAHPAAPELFDDAVVRNGLADHRKFSTSIRSLEDVRFLVVLVGSPNPARLCKPAVSLLLALPLPSPEILHQYQVAFVAVEL